jgi:hypothetical protein
MRHLSLVSLLALCLVIPGVFNAQTAQYTTPQVLSLYAGPGLTFEQVYLMNSNQPYTLEARNRLGNWVQIRHTDDPEQDGWTLTAALQLYELEDIEVDITALPITDLPDADVEHTPTGEIPDLLYTTPVLPPAINRGLLVEIYSNGRTLGNDPYTIAKVGDSNSASDQYLAPISTDQYDLGPYVFLADTVERFSPSFGRESIAARNGLNVSTVFDPFWASDETCEPNETPLMCEYRVNSPSIAFIMFGQNDVFVLSRDQYRDYLRRIVDETIGRGVIPVLSTFSNTPKNTENWDQVLALNIITIEVAQEYDIPLINFWLAARVLPEYGIADDFAHLTVSGGSVSFSHGKEAQFGLTLYNLAVLNMLDIIYRDVIEATETYKSERQ